jgi:hypothetical protein
MEKISKTSGIILKKTHLNTLKINLMHPPELNWTKATVRFHPKI